MRYSILVILIVMLISSIGFSQNIDNSTINKVKVKFIAAEEYYHNQDYKNTLVKILEIEGLMKNTIIPTALNLKIKALVGLRKYSEAKKELNTLETLNLDDAILKDMSVYSTKIDTEIKAEKLKKERYEKRIVVDFSFMDKIPLLPKCENKENNLSKKSCMEKEIVQIARKNFKAPTNSQIKGTQKIFALFKINTSGYISEINITASHDELKKEMKRVVQLIPKMKPGEHNGKIVTVKYTLPFIIRYPN